MNESHPAPMPAPAGRITRKKLILIVGIISLCGILALAITLGITVFRAKAEGIALGYLEAATTFYQMDRYARPLPDRIFETGAYRVETKVHGTPPVFEIQVRDRFFNITHFSEERHFDVSGRPTPPTGP